MIAISGMVAISGNLLFRALLVRNVLDELPQICNLNI